MGVDGAQMAAGLGMKQSQPVSKLCSPVPGPALAVLTSNPPLGLRSGQDTGVEDGGRSRGSSWGWEAPAAPAGPRVGTSACGLRCRPGDAGVLGSETRLQDRLLQLSLPGNPLQPCIHSAGTDCAETVSGFSSVQSLRRVRLFVTPRTAARQGSLSITNSWSLLKFKSIESVMPSNHLIPSPPAFSLSRHQGLFQGVTSSHQLAEGLESHGPVLRVVHGVAKSRRRLRG